MRRHRTVVVCAVLGLIVVFGAALQSTARFTGIRWIPDWTLPQMTAKPPPVLLQTGLGTPSPRPRPSTAGLDLSLLLWILIAAMIVIIVLVLYRRLAHRPPRETPALVDATLNESPDEPEKPSEPEPDAQTIRRGFAHALDILEQEREPHDAIVKAWLGLQEAAEESGIQRRGAETPTEFTLRIIGRRPADREAIDTLLNLYLRVRFGEYPVTTADVAHARGAFETLAASWHDTGGTT